MPRAPVFKTIGHRLFNLAGLHVSRLSKNPRTTLLGLRRAPIRTIIDIGANEGQFAKRAAALFPSANVYSFEPLPEPYEILSRAAAKEPGRLRHFNLAVGDKRGLASILQHVDHSPSSSFLHTTELKHSLYSFTRQQSEVKVSMLTLDEAVQELAIPLAPLVLVKMDVQGFEDRVIRGGVETLRKAFACLLEVNIDPLYEGQADFADLVRMLKDVGYAYAGNYEQICHDDGHVIFLDALFLKR